MVTGDKDQKDVRLGVSCWRSSQKGYRMRLAIIDMLKDSDCQRAIQGRVQELSVFVPSSLKATWHEFSDVKQDLLPEGARFWRPQDLRKSPSGRSVAEYILDHTLKPIRDHHLLGIEIDHRLVLITELPLTSDRDVSGTGWIWGGRLGITSAPFVP